MRCAADNKYYATTTMVNNQIAVLNKAYASANFKFTLSGIIKTTNSAWCGRPAPCPVDPSLHSSASMCSPGYCAQASLAFLHQSCLAQHH